MASVISAGTTSTTALNLSGDTTGVLQLQTNGTTAAMTIDTSQNVGIGTTSPSSILHIASSSQPTFKILYTAQREYGLTVTGGATTDGLAIRDESGSAEIARFCRSGNVGIGLTNPSTPLDVYGAINVRSGYNVQWGTSANYIAANTSLMQFGVNSAERMRITSGGDVGINETSPYSKLSITQGNAGNSVGQGAQLLMTSSTAINDRLNINFSQNGVSSRARAGIGAVAELANGYASALAFYTRNAIDSTALQTTDEKMRIDSSGNVGIGVSSIASSNKVQVSLASNTPTTGSPATGSIFNIQGGTTTVGDGPSLQLGNFSGAKETAWRISPVTTSGNNGDLVINGYTGGATYPERARFTNAGSFIVQASVSVGGVTPSASGAGITFPATQSASSDANTLDDYEEGDFTPTVIGSSTAGTVTYDTRFARYTKIGRVVYIEILLQWSNGTGTGNLKFGNLPFTCANATTFPSLSIGYINNVALSSGNIATAFVGSNEAAIYFYQTPTGGGASTTVPYDAAGYIQIAGCYTI